MKRDIPVRFNDIIRTKEGYAVFVTDGIKNIAFFIDGFTGEAICMAREGVRTMRPHTHMLIESIIAGLGAKVEKAVVLTLKEDIYFAHLYLSQPAGEGKHIVEIDARPSDCIALALELDAPLFVKQDVWEASEDMTWVLEQHDKDE